MVSQAAQVAGRVDANLPMTFSGPASGMAGDRGDDLAGVQRTKRGGVSGTPVSSSSGPRSRTREGNKARDPRSRERAAVVTGAGTAGLIVLREGRPRRLALTVARRAAQ